MVGEAQIICSEAQIKDKTVSFNYLTTLITKKTAVQAPSTLAHQQCPPPNSVVRKWKFCNQKMEILLMLWQLHFSVTCLCATLGLSALPHLILNSM